MIITELSGEQLSDIEGRLEEYDEQHIRYRMSGRIRLGIEEDGRLVAGLDACMTAFRILYVSTVFVDEDFRGKGYGKRLMLEMEKRARAMGATVIRLDTFDWQGKEFYEALGYEKAGSYRNDDEGYAEYFFLKRLGGSGSTAAPEDYLIRHENEDDRREVEELIRKSFWNVYRPGCSEHYVMHVLRDDPAFVRELDLVMEKNGRIIGQNMFMKTVIEADDGRVVDVLTMGPICIAPEFKRKGYGKALLDFSLEKAAGLGYGAVLFEGNIDFYGKSGFSYASGFGIRYHDLPEGADSSFFLCRELIPGYLAGVTGVYLTPRGYYVKDEDVEEFDKSFPEKKKLRLPGQIFGD